MTTTHGKKSCVDRWIVDTLRKMVVRTSNFCLVCFFDEAKTRTTLGYRAADTRHLLNAIDPLHAKTKRFPLFIVYFGNKRGKATNTIVTLLLTQEEMASFTSRTHCVVAKALHGDAVCFKSEWDVFHVRTCSNMNSKASLARSKYVIWLRLACSNRWRAFWWIMI